MLCSRRELFHNYSADLTAAGLQYVTDVSGDWSRVSMQVLRSPRRMSFVLVSQFFKQCAGT
jgi:hypothetical protein